MSDALSSNSDSSDESDYKIQKRDKKKSIGNTKNRTRQNHCRDNLIFPTKAIIKARDSIKEKLSEKETGPYQIMRKINGEVADDSV